jgi:FkbM family methyltransferase
MTTVQKCERQGALPRAWRFLQKPLREQARSAGFRWASVSFRCAKAISNIAAPVRLSFGAWWVPQNNNMRGQILAGTFEMAELAFVERFLQPGMTVLDLGAHNGLYSLLASRCVGTRGNVIAFEPSPRERRALRLHLILNRCRNVIVQSDALGSESVQANLFVVEGSQTGCNSLRSPEVSSGTFTVRVRVTRLDDWLGKQKIDRVDFIKLDVEGAELDALKGAAQLLERRPRPVILAEVADVRTLPWGYRAREIIQHLREREYRWFSLLQDASIEELEIQPMRLEGNFVACPEELVEKFERFRQPSEGIKDHVRSH